MSDPAPRKHVRSYRLVFRRRWRIFRVQGWRIPLPGGVELRLIGYWLACFTLILLASRLPLFGALVTALPPSLRLLAFPLAAAWGISRTEIDGRPPHRALVGLLAWRLRPHNLAALRRCPAVGAELSPLNDLALAPDLLGADYPCGRLAGPVRLLLRYPVAVRRAGFPRRRLWWAEPLDAPALHNGRTLDLPAGVTLAFEPER